MDEEKVKEMAEKINTSLEELKSSISEKANIEDLESRFEVIDEKLGELGGTEGFEKQQTQLDEISTQLKQLGEYQAKGKKSFDKELEEKLKSEDYKTQIKSKKRGIGEIGSFELESPLLKAETATTTAYITGITETAGEIETQTEPGVAVAPWRLNPIWAAIQKGTIGPGRDSISWWEEASRTDSAAMFTEATAVTTQSQKTWEKKHMDIMMIADHLKVSRSALEDFEYMKSEIQDLIQNGIPRKREKELLSGAGTTIYLKGVDEYAKTFAKPANFDKVPEANIADVINAAVLQVANGNTSDTNKRGYLANIALVNPGTIANLHGLKRSNGAYLLPPFVTKDGSTVAGVRLIPSLDMGNDQFIVGDFSQAKIFVKRNIRVSMHYENESDVLADLVLVFASMRLAGVRIKSPAEYAFVQGTFAASKALIEEVTG